MANELGFLVIGFGLGMMVVGLGWLASTLFQKEKASAAPPKVKMRAKEAQDLLLKNVRQILTSGDAGPGHMHIFPSGAYEDTLLIEIGHFEFRAEFNCYELMRIVEREAWHEVFARLYLHHARPPDARATNSKETLEPADNDPRPMTAVYHNDYKPRIESWLENGPGLFLEIPLPIPSWDTDIEILRACIAADFGKRVQMWQTNSSGDHPRQSFKLVRSAA